MILLIVDDERNIRNLMQSTLQRMNLGFSEILVAENGLEALKLSREKMPDIILTDIVMPWLNGHELVFEIQKSNPDCVFIMISGHYDISYLQKAINLQIFRFLFKPIDINELVDTLHLAMEESRRRKQLNIDYLYYSIYELIKAGASISAIRLEHCRILRENAEYLRENMSVAIIKTFSLILSITKEERILSHNSRFDLLSSSGIFQCSTPEDLVRCCQDIYDKIESLLDKASSMKHKLVLENACAFIEAHYMENIGAQDVAEYCGISTGHLSKIFNQHHQISIPQFITDLRLQHALDLIFDGKNTLHEIAQRCGFSSSNYFSKVFKGKYGKSPSIFFDEVEQAYEN